ncbi:LIM domain kinase 1-like, partial [Ctenocephalides felis]|uniref:LIM domain kinase 1-like n=1 Tax=Ctenocephalides felis TaxID=7515 RepID=UPI000E6E2BB5
SVSRLDVASELMSLHIGDKILEVNGTPVRDAPLENIENLIRYSDTVLQLTIEHDPESLTRRPSYTCPVINKTTLLENSNSEKLKALDSPKSKERLFRRRDEGYNTYSRSRQIRRRHAVDNTTKKKSAGGLTEKERSSSMSRLLDGSPSTSDGLDLSRTRSFRVEPKTQRVFRGSDLVQGELLGRGFFGQVFKVTHKVTQEVMVLKELYRVDEEAQRNFLKEVAVLRSLDHVNVLRFMGVLYRDKRLHLVTEYVPGGTLQQLLHDSTTVLSWEQKVTLAKDISSGMSYLHAQNIIHRDLNSHNCLVREDKTVIVADFGLARIVSQAHSNSMTRTSLSPNANGSISRRPRRERYTIVGNPYWMAPEMMKGNKYDEKVDIFSFGIVLCEIIGRVQADPDYLPRSADFGLNQTVFKDKFCSTCPIPFYKIAFLCCDLNPDKRPPFEVLEVWLEGMSMHLAVGSEISESLLFDVEHYKSQCSTPQSGSQSPESGTQSPGGGKLPHSSSKEKLLQAKREAMKSRDSTMERDEVFEDNKISIDIKDPENKQDNLIKENIKSKNSGGKQYNLVSDSSSSEKNGNPVNSSRQANKTENPKQQNNTLSSDLDKKLHFKVSKDNSKPSTFLDNSSFPKVSLKKHIFDSDSNKDSKVKLNRSKPVNLLHDFNKAKDHHKTLEKSEILDDNSIKLTFPKHPSYKTGSTSKGKYVNLANIMQDNNIRENDSCSSFSNLGKNLNSNRNSRVLESTAL